MEKKFFKPVIWGLILLVVGAVIFFAAWSRLDYGAVSVSVPDGESVRRSKTVDESFSSLSIGESACDIELLPAPDGVCRVEYSDSKFVVHKVYVKNNCLTIEEDLQERGVFRFNFGVLDSHESTTLVVYLPEAEYNSLRIDSAAANIRAAEGFSFRDAEIYTASGDVELGGVVSGELSVYSASGSISLSGLRLHELEAASASGSVSLENAEAADELKAETASGELYLSNIRCRSLEADSTSGGLELKNVACSGEMNLETTSGDISLERCDAKQLELESTSGSIKGSLLSGKDFRVDTGSGSIDVPEDSEGGICSIETTSGNVKISIA